MEKHFLYLLLFGLIVLIFNSFFCTSRTRLVNNIAGFFGVICCAVGFIGMITMMFITVYS